MPTKPKDISKLKVPLYMSSRGKIQQSKKEEVIKHQTKNHVRHDMHCTIIMRLHFEMTVTREIRLLVPKDTRRTTYKFHRHVSLDSANNTFECIPSPLLALCRRAG